MLRYFVVYIFVAVVAITALGFWISVEQHRHAARQRALKELEKELKQDLAEARRKAAEIRAKGWRRED